jgi:hypothetical protein
MGLQGNPIELPQVNGYSRLDPIPYRAINSKLHPLWVIFFCTKFPIESDFRAQITREAIPGPNTIIAHVDCPADPSDGENQK